MEPELIENEATNLAFAINRHFKDNPMQKCPTTPPSNPVTQACQRNSCEIVFRARSCSVRAQTKSNRIQCRGGTDATERAWALRHRHFGGQVA